MSFDVTTVGGGLAGSTLATELARAGYKVLILERETHFKDRVRGDAAVGSGGCAPIGTRGSPARQRSPSASVLDHLHGRQSGFEP